MERPSRAEKKTVPFRKSRPESAFANVVFPELLCGNEEQSLDYIEKFSANRRAYLIRTYTKSKKFFPKAVTILNKHRLPQEFKVLLALESAFNGNAVSKAGAVGYWQIMDEVAKEYGLKYAPQLSSAEKKRQTKELKKALAKKDSKKTKKLILFYGIFICRWTFSNYFFECNCEMVWPNQSTRSKENTKELHWKKPS